MMNLRRSLWVMLVCFLISVLTVYAGELDKKLDALTKQITSNMTNNKTLINNGRITIAVIEFSNIDGKTTLLGKSIAEQLTTKLFLTNKFNLVERGLLDKVLTELKLDQSGIIDSASAKDLGKILGVNAIITGTITELSKTVQLNARLIATETGQVFGVATVEMKKDEDIKKLLIPLNAEQETDDNITSKADTQAINNSVLLKNNASLDEAHSFVDPILAVIANKKPDYQDDFSNSKWDSEQQKDPNNSNVIGRRGYINGKYFMTAEPFSGIGGGSRNIPKLVDFVLDFDMCFISDGNEGKCQIDIRNDSNKKLTIGITQKATLEIRYHERNESDKTGRSLFDWIDIPTFKWGKDFNHIRIIAKSDKIAIVINEKQIAYVPNCFYLKDITETIRLWVCTNKDPLEIQFDNLKIWDISNINLNSLTELSTSSVEYGKALYQTDFEKGFTGWELPPQVIVEKEADNHVLSFSSKQFFKGIYASGDNWSDYCFSAQVKPILDPENEEIGFDLRVRVSKSGSFETSYLNGTFTLTKKYGPYDATHIKLGEGHFNLDKSKWYTISIITYKSYFEVTVDGQTVIQCADNELTKLPGGTILLTSNPNSHIHFDNIKVTSIKSITYKQNIEASPTKSASIDINATETPRPTQIPTKNTVSGSFSEEKALAFAGSVLIAIANKKPDYQDDFSDPKSGWAIGKQNKPDDPGFNGETQYENGEYSLIAAPTRGIVVSSSKLPKLLDFVLEIDQCFTSEVNGNWQLEFRDWRNKNSSGFTALMIDQTGNLRLYHHYFNNSNQGIMAEKSIPVNKLNGGYNHIQLIAKGPSIIVFFNGELLAYANDSEFRKDLIGGNMNLGVWSYNNWVSLQGKFDNLKIWDISQLNNTQPNIPQDQNLGTNKPDSEKQNTQSNNESTTNESPKQSPLDEAHAFADPILAAIANKAPDSKDDFSNPASGWDVLANNKILGYTNGAYFIEALPGSTMSAGSSKLPLLSDFVAELDWRFESSNPKSVWQIKYRWESEKRIDISPDGGFNIAGRNSDLFNALKSGPATFKPGKDYNHLTLIVKGPKIVLYIDSKLAGYATDPYYDPSEDGRINFWIGNENGAKPFRVLFDNLKIWDISDSKINASTVNKSQNSGATIKQVPSQFPTIQAAINAAKNGDEIIVAPGTYQEIIDFKGKNITVRGTNPDDPQVVAATVINGEKFKYMRLASNNCLTSNSGFSVVVFRNGETSAAVLEGFTITKGNGTFTPTDWSDGLLSGGGIYISNKSAPTIRKNIITNNWGVIGGGISISNNSNPIICFNTISNNVSEATGGGIIIWNGSHPTLYNNIFDGNLGKGGGGGIQVESDSSAKIYSNTFKNNSSIVGNGGAIKAIRYNIFQADGKTPITDSDGINTFTDNQAKEFPNINY